MVTGLVGCQADHMVTELPCWHMASGPNHYMVGGLARRAKCLRGCAAGNWLLAHMVTSLVGCMADQMVTGVLGWQMVNG